MKPGTPASAGRVDGLLALAVMVALWKLAAMGIHTEIILPSPERVFSELIRLASTRAFTAAFLATAARGLAAFGASMVIGTIVGFAAGSSRRFESLLEPGLTVIRATPVLAVILLALIWFPSGVVPIFSAVVMAFPVVAADIAAGIRSADPKLLEMAHSFGVSRHEVSLHVRLPSATPHAVAAAKNAIGLVWKVVVAGEVLSQPARAIGTGMQNARIMLETAGVFAWAAAGIVLCFTSDAVFNAVLRRLSWPTK